jgi:hypothetical protein
VAVDRVAVGGGDHARVQMGDDLVAVQVEVDPAVAAAALRAAEQPAVEGAGGGQIVDGEGEMKGAYADLALAARCARDDLPEHSGA